MDTKQPTNKKSEEEMGEPMDEQNLNAGHKPFFMGLHSNKFTPIGPRHQIQVPSWDHCLSSASSRRQQLEKREIWRKPKPVSLVGRVPQEDLDEYLAFAETYFEEKNPDSFSPGYTSKERMRSKALDFLHKMDYSIIKAKFYILFPLYLAYNGYRCHDPLNISIEDMGKKIKDHLQGLKNTKEKDTEKWIKSLRSCLETRTPITKFNSLVDLGKTNKLELPEDIRELYEKANKAGREIKKSLMGNKFPIETLREKRKQSQEHNLITNEMVALEDTVNRCEQWIKKFNNFEEAYFETTQTGAINLKETSEKIQFRQMNALVNQYANLPLIDPLFESSVKKLHQQTQELLDRMPTFNRVAKTRTAKQQTHHKISYQQMQDYLQKIDVFPVYHEEFSNFQINMRESMELIERLSMYLEDPLADKNSKALNNYLKLISDIQIQNNIQKRLKQRQEYNEIMEKIKRQITNPGKVESIKQAYNKLKEKGIKQVEDSGYQEKILLYLGWHQSQQKLKQAKPKVTNIELIEKELDIKKKLVDVDSFKEQLQSAQKELNISREDLEESYKRLQIYKQNEKSAIDLLNDKNPNLEDMLGKLRQCIDCGLSFPEFESLYEQVVKFFSILAKVHYLLKIKEENLDSDVDGDYFFTSQECDHILSMIVYNSEIKDLKTKEGAEMILSEMRDSPFPRYLKECVVFEDFMRRGQEWAENVRDMIKNFTENGESIDVKQLQQSRYFIHSRAIKQEIAKIELIMKWREKISKKFDEEKLQIFSEEEQDFLYQMQKDLIGFESSISSMESSKFQFLQYYKSNNTILKKILHHITVQSQVQNTYKLTEMNKFHREIEKEIDRQKIDDKKILELKEKLKDQIELAVEWKERYLIIKRYEWKKINKKQDKNDEKDDEKEDAPVQRESLFNVQDLGNDVSHTPNEPSQNHKKKYSVSNGEFTWYFKFLIMILEFYKGYKLKFSLEELLRLKLSLIEISKFIQHFDNFNEKSDPSDAELSSLEAEGAKIQIFISEYWILKRRNAYVSSWKLMADAVLDSVPIISMELKARKPEELLSVLANKKMETEEANKTVTEEKNVETFSQKRQRRPNSLYSNNEITLFFDENIGQKAKKRKKGSNGDTEYRNTAVASQAKKNQRNKIEEIQRTEALLNGQIPASLLIEDPKEYCICRFGEPNENTTMVQCEGRCQEWFHIQCIGIKKHQAKGDTSYVCVACNALYDMKTTGNFFWNYRQKMSQYAFREIVEEGKNLGISTQQMKKIKVVDDKLKAWKEQVQSLLLTIMKDEFNGKSLKVHEQKLYQVYLMSFWLPTFHTETSTLRRLLLLSRDHGEYM